jgi:tripeptide aminopeptidase
MQETSNLHHYSQRLQCYLERLLNVDSPSQNESAAAVVIKNVLDTLGVAYIEDDSAMISGSDTGNIIAGGSKNRVAFCAHMDTIQIYEKSKYVIKDGIVSGAGGGVIGIDDKTGVAVLLAAIAYMQENGGIPDDVGFIFTTCEEKGFAGAWNLDERHFVDAYNFVVDSGGLPVGRVVSRGASQYDIMIDVEGRMSHTGHPDGPHALLLSAELLGHIKTGRVSKETFVNISDLKCEGNDNTIPKRVTVRGQILSFDDDEALSLLREMDIIVRGFLSQHGLSGGLAYACTAPGYVSDADIVAYAQKAAASAQLPFEEGWTGAGSDAHVLTARGAKALKISSGMMNVHSDEEYVSLADLGFCVRYVLALAGFYD